MPTPQRIRFRLLEKMLIWGAPFLHCGESYRNDLRETKRITGFEYVRFHAIFHDEVGVYTTKTHSGTGLHFLMWIRSMTDAGKQGRPFGGLSFMPKN